MKTGTIQQVDPSTLTIALNVRTDARLDKEFVASIRELGVLQPPMVIVNDSGGHDVVLGQRRVLAALEAELKTIPVYVVEKTEADAARLIDQLTENEQRQTLTRAELVQGYKQLALFGLSPAQIAKKVSRPRKQVDLALAIADDDGATNALDVGLTLDQAAVMVDFASDRAARKRLEAAAADGQFDHVAAQLLAKRILAQHVETLKSELTEEQVTVLPLGDQPWHKPTLDGKTLTPIEYFGKPDQLNEPLDPSDVEDKTLLAARVVMSYMEKPKGGYGEWAQKQYFVIDAESNGFLKRQNTRRELTPEEAADETEREAYRKAQAAKEEAFTIATEVRIAWAKDFLQRKTLPPDALKLVILSASVDNLNGLEIGSHTPVWLGEAAEELTEERREELITRFGETKLLLAAAIQGYEGALDRSWSRKHAAPWYFPFLMGWGYQLSPAEQALLEVKTDEDEDEDEEA